MKNERRHALQSNDLADRLAYAIESIRPYISYILGGIAVIILATIFWGIYANTVAKNSSLAWTEYYFNLASGDVDAFRDVAEEFPDSSAALWARQSAGANLLQQGIESLYRNRSEGEDQLQQAIGAFEQVIDSAYQPDLKSQALLGLAQAHESLGNVDQAIDYYQQAREATAEPAIVNVAGERLAFLNSEDGKSFYDWFSQLDPKPDAPIELPDNLTTPPTSPDIDFGNLPQIPSGAANADQGDVSGLPAVPDIDPSAPADNAVEESSDDSKNDIQVPDSPPVEGNGSQNSSENAGGDIRLTPPDGN